jgi:hypothetical protein
MMVLFLSLGVRSVVYKQFDEIVLASILFFSLYITNVSGILTEDTIIR